MYVRDHATFFYVLETVFDVCLIYVEEYWNNQTELCDKTTLDMYVCIALMLQKDFCGVSSHTALHWTVLSDDWHFAVETFKAINGGFKVLLYQSLLS